MQPDQSAAHVAAILQAAYLVRHYQRPHQRTQKDQAIAQLGQAARAALNACDDPAPVLRAICDGLVTVSTYAIAI